MSRFHAFSSGNTGQPASDGLRSGTPASPAAITPASPAAITPASTDESTPAPAAPASAVGFPESKRAIGPPQAKRASNTHTMRIYRFKLQRAGISTRSQDVHPPARLAAIQLDAGAQAVSRAPSFFFSKMRAPWDPSA